MNKDKDLFSQITKLFILGFCAIFLGTATRYYTVQGLGSEKGALNQAASVGFQAAQVDADLTNKSTGTQENAATQTKETNTTGDSSRPATNTPNIQEGGVAAVESPTQNIAENNPAPVPQQEAGLPNLTVTNVTISPLPMDKNKVVRITATAHNTGTGQATNVSGSLSNTTNGYALGSHAGYTFAPGQQYEFWEEDAYPYFAVCTNGGANVLRFTIDPLNKIQESNENDNTFEITAALVGC